MILVLLHGLPATGKYTVGRELAALTGYELFHNHLVVDEVLQRHAFGTPEFVAERDRRWREHFVAAARRQPPGLIFTFNPESTVPQEFVDWLFQELPRHGVDLRSVALVAGEAAIETRLDTAQRADFGKLRDLDLYRRLREGGAFDSPVILRTDLEIDTEDSSPAAAAREIRARLGLD